MGLYATVRVGPYVCAEWDSGGYPVWAKFKPDVVVRGNNPGYIALQDHWLAEILPRIAAHQIHRGGNVVLLQLENEGAWWGAWEGKASDPYYQDLYDNAKRQGIEIPFFMSGFNHGTSPVLENADNAGRTCPWISTETWTGWYSNYGASDYQYMRILRSNSKLLARGASGQNFYMLHGGSNFASWNDNETAATYDYGTIIGQAGDLRPIYFALKANQLFATSFSQVLDHASLAVDAYRDFASAARVIGARKSPAGTVVFVQGLVGSVEPAVLKSVGRGAGGSLHIPALEVAQIVLDAPLAAAPANIKIVQATSRILGVARNGPTTTLILFGEAGDRGSLTLALGDVVKLIRVGYPSDRPEERIETAAGHTLRILSLSHQLSDRTWIVGPKGRESVVVGPEYVGEFSIRDGRPRMTIERPYGHPAPNKVIVYGRADVPAQHLAVKADMSRDDAPPPALSAWKTSLLSEMAPQFDDSAWMSSEDPVQMGADGDISAFAWYRAAVESPAAGPATLHFPGAADNLVVFVNGKRCKAAPSIANLPRHCDELRDGKLFWTAAIELLRGRNVIAVLASHQGRDKAGGYYGPIDHYYPKGIYKPVHLEMAGRKIPVKGWRMRGGIPAPESLALQPLGPACGSPAFFQASFTARPPSLGPNPILRATTRGLSRGTMFINGRCVGRYPEVVKYPNSEEPVGLYLPECWLSATGRNTLAIFDEEGRSPSGVRLQVEKAASREVIAVSETADPRVALAMPVYRPVDMRQSGRLNLASDRPATASSCDPRRPASDINDGDGETAWAPASVPTAKNPAWVARRPGKTLQGRGRGVRRVAVPGHDVFLLRRRIARRRHVDHARRPTTFAQRQGELQSGRMLDRPRDEGQASPLRSLDDRRRSGAPVGSRRHRRVSRLGRGAALRTGCK